MQTGVALSEADCHHSLKSPNKLRIPHLTKVQFLASVINEKNCKKDVTTKLGKRCDHKIEKKGVTTKL